MYFVCVCVCSDHRLTDQPICQLRDQPIAHQGVPRVDPQDDRREDQITTTKVEEGATITVPEIHAANLVSVVAVVSVIMG